MGKYKDYEPEFLGVFLSLLVLNLWYLSSVAIDNNFIPVSYNFIINSLIALVSTFVGAYSAFSLNNRKETKKIYIDISTLGGQTESTYICVIFSFTTKIDSESRFEMRLSIFLF